MSSISLACGLLTNLLLFVNLGSYFPLLIAQIPVIIGGISSCLIVLVIIVVFALHSSHTNSYDFTQAFYYAMISAILYFLIAVLTIIVSLGIYFQYYPKRFNLRETERRLLLQCFSLMIYLLVGSVVFAKIEHWTYLDAVFWADFTLLTIGLGGKYAPTTDLARILLLPYAIGGIMILGGYVSSLHAVLETAKKELEQQLIENRRRTLADDVRKSHLFTAEHAASPSYQEFIKEEVFQKVRTLKIEAGRKARWFSLVISILFALILWFASAAVFWRAMKSQQWTYPSALYFSYISFLTIGYGDLMPESNSAKPLYVLWTLLAVPVLTIVVSNLGGTLVEDFQNILLFLGSITILPDPRILKAMIKNLGALKRGNLKPSAKCHKLSELAHSDCEI
jgi:potassium channel subfamily K, other eukaryote